jgi:hypothetical protein
MADDRKRHEDQPAGDGLPNDLSVSEDEAILDARVELDEALREYLVGRPEGRGAPRLLAALLSEGLLVSVLKLIAPNGKYPMDKGRFWQLLDRHCPFDPEDAISTRLESEIEGLFGSARYETFEDGFDSTLSFELQRLVLRHGEMTLQIVSDLILEERVAPQAAAEALRCMGGMENPTTRETRRQLLERALDCSSHLTRDSAVIGLSDLRDPRSVTALERAAAREPYQLLQADMLTLIEDLKGLPQ